MTAQKGLHGMHIRFLAEVPEWGMKIDYCIPENEQEYRICDMWGNDVFLDKDKEGSLYVREYFEYAANIFDTVYTPRQISEFRLNVKREHAKDKPDGRTAELVGYIDWLLCRMEKMYEVLDDMPTSIEDLVDFSECPSDDED